MDAFGILDEGYIDPEVKVQPFFKVIEKKKPKELHEWLNSVTDALIEQSETRTRIQRENLSLYRGVSIRKWERSTNRDSNYRRISKIQRFVVNHLYDLTETKVSQMTRLKPAVEVLPTNDEWEDRASAKVVQNIIKHLWYINDVDGNMTRMQREARIFGEAFTFVVWDKEAGDLTPAYVAARDAGLDVNRPEIQDIKFTGDIKYEAELPWRVLLQRKPNLLDCEYVIRPKVVPTELLKKQYPKKKNQIKETEDFKVFDAEDLTERVMEHSTLIFEFFHKKTKDVPEGKHIIFTKDVVLQDEDHPFSHGELPLIRLTDLDVPDVLNGVSRYESISAIQRMHNNLSTLIAKNIYLTAQAKWVLPRGAAKLEQLGNDNTIIQYQGNVPPQMIQATPNSPEVYAFRDRLVEEMQRIYGSHGISRGEVPKGITAASALQFLNELENERATSDIAKHGKVIKDMAKMTIAVVGDKYDPEDGRMIRIVGENNKFLIRHFDTAHLHKSYDIRFDNSTGLPETKAAKTQRILEAMQRNPSMLSGERWTELLELANVEKMNSLISEAIKAADSENEDMLSKRDVAMPEEWEDHIQHWDAHIRVMQSRQFKEEADPLARAKMKDHVYWTEEAMIDKMRNNPEFEAKLATLTLFPVFHHEGFIAPRSLEQQIAMVQGQANRGDKVTGQIPGSNPEDIINLQNAKNQIKGK